MNRTAHLYAIVLLAVATNLLSDSAAQAGEDAAAAPDDQITVVEIDNSLSCMRYFPAFGKALKVPCRAETPEPTVKVSAPPVEIDKPEPAPIEDVKEEEAEVEPALNTEVTADDEQATSASETTTRDSSAATRPKPTRKAKPAPRKKRVKSRKTYRKRTTRVRSCGGCRNACYVRYRVRSHSRRFVPCMRKCWHRSC